ncbi:carboxypeptidase-like regulatory domain-containing protein [Oscillochloris sp. ZM17-4]|uniref:carboxypeptidase-like regulatory domain-containing protein n=1 Tax=Oscillochloris sp. ZM17-4 TaxID=2866714 RepID=UPI001C72E983|nr:carboxypeptidase-like regulatory domain-containing protein [Oscillochloris sp. ZM17-4]MBX0326557.1 carboxypeptidase-like regulatory domain-containing protein [Oscillochloris sp. ZM17-4]
MRRQMSSFALMVCGIIAMVGGFTMLPSPAAVSAQATQPSPRPTLQPTPDFNQRDSKPTAVIPGRLTGTIIDLRTGAPAAGIAVVVGGQTVYSDSNGNYDIWLTSGYYRLELEPTSSQGTSIQPAQAIAVGPGDTVVIHLFFTSPAPTEGIEAVVPPVIEPTPTAAPQVALPPSLPDTSVAHSVAVATPAESLSAPESLPNTAATAGLGNPGTWILVGALLLGVGLVIQLAPRPRRRLATARRSRASIARRTTDDDTMLADLLDGDIS